MTPRLQISLPSPNNCQNSSKVRPLLLFRRFIAVSKSLLVQASEPLALLQAKTTLLSDIILTEEKKMSAFTIISLFYRF